MGKQMVIHELDGPASPELERALAEFESRFTHPLAPGRFFRIVHCGDPVAYLRTMGEEARCYAAEKDGRIVGTFSAVLTRLRMPDGTERLAAYVPDVKVLPEARKQMLLARLMQAAWAWARPKTAAMFSVVMDGTPIKPSAYTGRVGIETFSEVGKVIVVRLPPGLRTPSPDDRRFLASRAAVVECYNQLSQGRYSRPADTAQDRSVVTPVWLMHPDGLACGRLEDRRKIRRLFADDGTELLPSYLSCFAFRTPQAGLELIRVARRLCAELGFNALRVCVAEPDGRQLRRAVGPVNILMAAATIYATGLEPGHAWNVNCSEI